MTKFVCDCISVILGFIAAWAGYLIGRTGEELSVLFVNWIIGK